MQPRWLVAQLEELDYQTDFQVELVNSLLYQVQTMSRLTEDYVGFAKNDVRAVEEMYQSLVKHYNSAQEHALSRAHRANEQVEVAQTALIHSQDYQQKTGELVQFWQHQKKLAESWVEQAIHYLQQCEHATRVAQNDLSTAESELSRAEIALSHARRRTERKYVGTDSKGRDQYITVPVDTSFEEAAVARAQSAVSRARHALQRAEAEERAARNELSQAREQLHGTKLAKADANTASEMAADSVDTATDGKRQADYGQSQAQKCLELLDQVKHLLVQFKQTCEQQSQVVAELDADVHQSFLHMRDVEGQQESIQGEAFSLKYTLQDKVSLLIAYDQPLSR